MNLNRWTILTPLAVLATGVMLVVFNHPVLGGEIVAAALVLLRGTTNR